ncbi:MAG: hypothetical protein EBY41_04470, partial [Proteobacteria bacterium]|nr:hypothetical protein [Pseudomonadota bacterium]
MKALVIGDVMLDEYWLGDTNRISPEAPVPIIKITDENFKLGGAGNVAANLAYLGIDVTLVGLIGIDKEAEHLKKIIEKQNIKMAVISFENLKIELMEPLNDKSPITRFLEK